MRKEKMAVHFSSETSEHYTPPEILDAVIECFGELDLDPCSNSHDAPNVPAKKHYTRQDDGLVQRWEGKVFMNPPYGREIKQWVKKLIGEYETGDVYEAIVLAPSRTDTEWFGMLSGFPVCFVSGRIVFLGNKNGAPFPSAIFYMGGNFDKFFSVFRKFGIIRKNVESCWTINEPHKMRQRGRHG